MRQKGIRPTAWNPRAFVSFVWKDLGFAPGKLFYCKVMITLLPNLETWNLLALWKPYLEISSLSHVTLQSALKHFRVFLCIDNENSFCINSTLIVGFKRTVMASKG